jgi:hypothetical protein
MMHERSDRKLNTSVTRLELLFSVNEMRLEVAVAFLLSVMCQERYRKAVATVMCSTVGSLGVHINVQHCGQSGGSH